MPYKVLVISDPQIIGLGTYPGRSELLTRLSWQITDAYARKSFKAIMKHNHPDAVIFLGDLLDTGADVTNPGEWVKLFYLVLILFRILNVYGINGLRYDDYVNRFRNIFSYPSTTTSSIPVIYVPGNHDRGLSTSTQDSAPRSRTKVLANRFTRTFGPVNGHLDLGNHTFIWFDSQKLIEEIKTSANSSRNERNTVIPFLENMENSMYRSRQWFYAIIITYFLFFFYC